MTCDNHPRTTHEPPRQLPAQEGPVRNTIRLLAAVICPRCGWWAETGHTCHPADR